MKIEEFTYDDIKDVLTIYGQGIETGCATFQTEIPTVEDWNKAHLPFARLKAVDESGNMLGWAALSPTSSRYCYRGVTEMSIYIAKDQRKKGIGEKLIQAMIDESEKNEIWTIQSGIFENNVGSLALHSKCGFRKIGYRERVAKDCHCIWRSVVLMERRSNNPIFD